MAGRSEEPKAHPTAKTSGRKPSPARKPTGKGTGKRVKPASDHARKDVAEQGSAHTQKPSAAPPDNPAAIQKMARPSKWERPSVLVTEPGVLVRPAADTRGDDLAIRITSSGGGSEFVVLDDELSSYREELIAQLDEVVIPAVMARILQGASPTAPEVLARRMLAVAPVPVPGNRMADQVGPEFYDTTGVTVVLAGPGKKPISKQAVEDRRRRSTIVALPTAEGRWIYPTWQFRDHDLLPGLAEVLAAFRQPVEDRSQPRESPYGAWSVGTWLTTPREDLGGLTPAEWLALGLDAQVPVTRARRTVAAWVA